MQVKHKPVDAEVLVCIKVLANRTFVNQQRLGNLRRLPAFAQQDDGFNTVGNGSVPGMFVNFT